MRTAVCRVVFQILENMPRGHAELSDQLRRATISIPLIIAEGAGKTTDKDLSRYTRWLEALPWSVAPSSNSAYVSSCGTGDRCRCEIIVRAPRGHAEQDVR